MQQVKFTSNHDWVNKGSVGLVIGSDWVGRICVRMPDSRGKGTRGIVKDTTSSCIWTPSSYIEYCDLDIDPAFLQETWKLISDYQKPSEV